MLKATPLAALAGAALLLASPTAEARGARDGCHVTFQPRIGWVQVCPMERRHGWRPPHHQGWRQPQHGGSHWQRAPSLLPPVAIVSQLRRQSYRAVRVVGREQRNYHVHVRDARGRPLLLVVDGQSARILKRQRLN